MLTSDGNEQVLIGLLSNIYFWIFSISISSIFLLFKKYIYTRFQKIKIKKIDIRNVPKFISGNQIPVYPDSNDFINYVENELVIKNPKDELLIHELVIDDIEVLDYSYEDTIVQKGFDYPNQRVDFVMFNNGNKCSNQVDYQLFCWYLNRDSNEKILIFEDESKIKNLQGGDIKKIFSIDLTDYTISKHFSDDFPDCKQLVKLELINKFTKTVESEIEIPYMSSGKCFCRNRGGGTVPIDRTIIPIVELVSPYKQKCYKFTINHMLLKGENTFRFNILVDAPISLSYRVKILSNKKELAVYSQKPFFIKFPKYQFAYSTNENISYYLIKNGLDESDFEDVELREPSLINTVNGIKQEFNL